jgi:hypothetical protein
MLTVEDLLDSLYQLVTSGVEKRDWNANFISNVTTHVKHGRALTINQGKTVVKLAANHIGKIAALRKIDANIVKQAINTPKYNQPPVESADIKREVRYLGGNKLAFRFKHDPIVIAEIKGLKSSSLSNDRSFFHKDFRVWVSSSNLEKVFTIIKKNKFNFDDDVLQFMLKCTNSKNKSPTLNYDAETGNILIEVIDNPIFEDLIKFALGGQAL